MGKSNNDWKHRLGMVYSTNRDFVFTTDEENDTATVATLPAQQQRLRVNIERSGRKGKTVTVVRGFVGSEEDLKLLGKLLKTKLSVGGSEKDGEILIQGEIKEKVIALLQAEGYKQTK